MNARTTLLCLLATLASACGPGAPTSDAGPEASTDAGNPDAPAQCSTDRDCTDGVFCNGAELCAPGDPGADPRGCVAPSQTACRPTQTCDEAHARCVTDCATNPDADGDGHRARECGGDDCDDADFNRAPGRPEVCDARDRDEDCDPTTFGSRDDDADGFTDAQCCNTDDSGARHCGTDCNDMSARIRPDAQESCNGVDDNCNGTTDEGLIRSYHPDADGDRFGAAAGAPVTACTAPPGFVENATDCNDADPAANPAAPEVCDGADNDCDGMTDEGLGRAYHPDADGDQFGNPDPALAVTACRAPAGFVENATDCDDAEPAAHPGAVESCDGVDNDCDGATDPGLLRTFYADADGDGYGQIESGKVDACGPPAGYVATTDDCDDMAPNVHPGAPEVCDGIDNNCDFGIDEYTGTPQCAAGLSCVAGACRALSCSSSVQDCDGDPSNGCEADVSTDLNNCGVCGLACGLGGACTNGSCDAPVAVVVGRAHTCALRSDGLAVCWGDDTYAQHGVGAGASAGARATVVAGVRGIAQLAAGADFTCARTDDGSVWCWGRDDAHQLGGSGNTVSSAQPLRVLGIADAVDLAAGDRFACAVRRTGEVTCWGANERGQLGEGDTALVALPVPAMVRGAVSVAAGRAHACAVTADGTVFCWGDNTTAQLGLNADANPHPTPVAVTGGLPNALQVVAGRGHACARAVDGTAWCWGDNSAGQGGVDFAGGTIPPTVVSTGVTTGGSFDRLAAGGNSSAALAGGAAYTWGDNASGQLALSGTGPFPSPAPTNFPLNYDVRSIAIGVAHSCAVTAAGEVYCWGDNSAGQLGDSTLSSGSVPVLVQTVSNLQPSGGAA